MSTWAQSVLYAFVTIIGAFLLVLGIFAWQGVHGVITFMVSLLAAVMIALFVMLVLLIKEWLDARRSS